MRTLIRIFKTFSRLECLIFIGAILIFFVSLIFTVNNFINQKTILVAVAGGEYIEGIIGQPSFINPILVGNNDADRDLVKLIFSNVLDLAENYKMIEDGKTWSIRLKDGLVWHDGQPIVSDDVVFTIKTIQDPDSHSLLFPMWQGITAERISEREIKLTLSKPYAFFENTLKELRPIPKHIFESIPAANLRLSDYNLEPIGSGPFKFVSLKKERSGYISEYRLAQNESYFSQKPYLSQMIFKFYRNEDELIDAFNSGAISGFGGINEKDLSKINIVHQTLVIRMPRYYAIFFNPNAQPALKDRNVRLALNYATDRKSLIEKVFDGQALLVNGPLIPGMKGYAADVYPEENFSLEKANSILDNSSWQLNEEGIREKRKEERRKKTEAQRLEFNLMVPEIPFLIETAQLIQQNWSKIGVRLNLIIKPVVDVNNEIIKTRNYEMIIFGNIFANSDSPDLSSFWHSSERFYPGLNLALYENKTADALIESIRENFNNDNKRQRDLTSLQSLIIQDLPAIFLFSPNYFYISKTWLKGFDEKFIDQPSDRFDHIEKWYIKTARVFK